MVIMSGLLLAVLFIAGLVNICNYFPTKTFHSWIRSFLFGKATPVIDTDSDSAYKFSVSSEKKAKELKRVFATFDKNGDGLVTKQEIRDSLKNLGLLVTDKEVEEMVSKVDTNGDGLIDFEEFCLLYEAMAGHPDYEKDDDYDDGEGALKEAFDVFDKDKDGLISVEELGSVLSSLGLNEGKEIENCKEMIKKVDKDGDGMVDFNEFKKMMKAGGILF